MIAYNTTREELEAALNKTREVYPTLIWECEPKSLAKHGKTWKFRIKHSRNCVPGSVMTPSGKFIRFASWECTGTFFNALYAIQYDAYITSRGRRVLRQPFGRGAVWEDWPVATELGCAMMGLYYMYAHENDAANYI